MSPLALIYKAAFPIARMYWTIIGGELYGVRCLILCEDQVLLIRQTYGHEKWSLPGGRIARNESADAAALREIKEETGIAIASLVKLGEFTMTAGKLRDTVKVFCAEVATQKVTIDPNEIQEACWFDLKDLPSTQSPHLTQSLSLYIASREQSKGNPRHHDFGSLDHPDTIG